MMDGVPPSRGAPEVGDVPLGLEGIAELLNVQPRTPSKWRDRGVLPPPDGRIGSGHADYWWRSRVLRWHAERVRAADAD
jgi:hypothetical protein